MFTWKELPMSLLISECFLLISIAKVSRKLYALVLLYKPDFSTFISMNFEIKEIYLRKF